MADVSASDKGTAAPGKGKTKPAPQPTKESFPVKTSAKTADQKFGRFS